MADLEVKMDASSQQPNPPHMDLEATLAAERDGSADPRAEDVLSVHQDLGRPLDLFLPAPSDTEPGCWPPRPEEIRKDPVSPEESEQVSNPLPPSVQVSAGSSPGKSRDRIEEGDVQPQFDHEPGQSLTTDAGPAMETQSGPSETSGVDPSHLCVESEDREDDADLAKECPESDFVHLRGLLDRLQRLSPLCRENLATSGDGPLPASDSGEDGHVAGEDDERSLLLASAEDSGAASLLHIATGHGSGAAPRRLYRPAQRSRESHSLLSVDADREDLLGLLRYEGGVPEEKDPRTPLACSDAVAGGGLWETRVGAENPDFSPGSVPGEPEKEGPHRRVGRENIHLEGDDPLEPGGETDHGATGSEPTCEEDGATKADVPSPAFKEVPGPCEAEDLLEGVIFGAKYLGSTQLISDRNPPTNIRMAQAQEAVDRIKAPEGESQPMTEVDLFVSTQRIKVLTADSQETMMDHSLQTISYIADIGNIVVLMARRRLPRRADTPAEKQLYKMICHVFHSTDAQVIAQAIGQAFSVAFQRFLEASGIDPSQLATRGRGKDDEEDALAKVEDLYNGDLAHFSKQENCKEVIIPKQKGEILGIVIVESGWGSILPTVVVANLMHRGAAERSGKLSIGDRIMSVNGTSLVGLPLVTCQSIIRDLKHQTEVTLCVVHCPPVTTAIVQRPDTKYPLGFCVENGIICSLMRGGIAERGGIRVGHRIIEINGQSVVAVPHEKIIEILTQAVSEVRIKTMPASTYRLLTGQEQPVFL